LVDFNGLHKVTHYITFCHKVNTLFNKSHKMMAPDQAGPKGI